MSCTVLCRTFHVAPEQVDGDRHLLSPNTLALVPVPVPVPVLDTASVITPFLMVFLKVKESKSLPNTLV